MDHAKELGFGRRHLEFSPIKGPEGNIEYLLHLVKNGEDIPEICPEKIVAKAHEELR